MKYSKGHSNDRAGNKMFMHGHKDGRSVLSITTKPCGRGIKRKIITQRDEPNFHVIFLLPNQNQEKKMKCDLTSFSTVLRSYQDDGRVIMKGSVKDLRSNPGPLYESIGQHLISRSCAILFYKDGWMTCNFTVFQSYQ